MNELEEHSGYDIASTSTTTEQFQHSNGCTHYRSP